jgi:hypothetical protein
MATTQTESSPNTKDAISAFENHHGIWRVAGRYFMGLVDDEYVQTDEVFYWCVSPRFLSVDKDPAGHGTVARRAFLVRSNRARSPKWEIAHAQPHRRDWEVEEIRRLGEVVLQLRASHNHALQPEAGSVILYRQICV